MARQKCGTLIGLKDKNPQKNKGANNQISIIEKENEEIDITNHKTPKEVQVHENSKNKEILISYVSIKKRWNQNEIIIDNIFSYNILLDIVNENKDLKPKSVEEYRRRNDWSK